MEVTTIFAKKFFRYVLHVYKMYQFTDINKRIISL